MSIDSADVSLRTIDGLHLAATLVRPEDPDAVQSAVVLVHGGGVTRHEGGFFTRLADGLAQVGVASLRFDLRGHGESGGLQQELTLSAILNDIRVTLAWLQERTGAPAMHLLGTSFGGGICGYYAAKRPHELTRLVMLNPQLNYKRRTIDNKPYWHDDVLSDEAAADLSAQGYLEFSPTLRHGRAMLNEVFWLRPDETLGEIVTPTLIVHGTGDTLVPIESTHEAMPRFQCEVKLVEIEGAQHGFAVPEDPQYLNPQSQIWHDYVIETVSAWLTDAPRS